MKDDAYYLEEKQNDKSHGRSIILSKEGLVRMFYQRDGQMAPGKYLTIRPQGEIRIGELFPGENPDSLGGEKWMMRDVNGEYEESTYGAVPTDLLQQQANFDDSLIF